MDGFNGLNPRALFEQFLYGFSAVVFALSSLFLGMDVLLSALVVFSFIIGFFFRGWVVPVAALVAYAAAVVVSPPDLSLFNVLVFGLFSALPFFICFRTANAKSAGFVPVEPFGVLIPVFVAAALFMLDVGFFFSSTESVLPYGVVAVSLLALLALALTVPLLAEAWKRLGAAG